MSPPSPIDEPSSAGAQASRAPGPAAGSSFSAPSAFGITGFDTAAVEPGRPAVAVVASRSAFDVCHAGVVLRTVLFVHGVVAIGTAFVAATPGAWLQLFALGSVVALPGLLLWLIVACLLKRRLARLPERAQWVVAVGLGALCGAAGWAQLWASGFAETASSVPSGPLVGAPVAGGWLAPMFAGAALAAAVFHWLRLRALGQAPADAAARLAELQSRIRPHFLFNTLNTAIALARVDAARTEDLLEDLAELFRVALDEHDAAVPLSQEVDLARRYLAIEQIRFGSRLQLSWELDPAAAEARVPPLLLQPLVENAVRHGVEPSAEGGVIRVRTRVRHGRAEISIANTVAEGASRPGHGMALRNVRERLLLMHDVAAQFDARLDDGVYRVRIVVPL